MTNEKLAATFVVNRKQSVVSRVVAGLHVDEEAAGIARNGLHLVGRDVPLSIDVVESIVCVVARRDCLYLPDGIDEVIVRDALVGGQVGFAVVLSGEIRIHCAAVVITLLGRAKVEVVGICRAVVSVGVGDDIQAGSYLGVNG